MLDRLKNSLGAIPRLPGCLEALSLILKGSATMGYCPVCKLKTVFLKRGPWLRDYYICLFCRSIPRQRALMHHLNKHFPNWIKLSIFESSPNGASSKYLKSKCRDYIPSQFWPDVPLGDDRNGMRCENLESLTFKPESFDLIITQDVFEHVLNPDAGFREVARVLKPGGAHVFTIPVYDHEVSMTRARANGKDIEYLAEPQFHKNPIDPNGSLVVTEWGYDVVEYIYKASGLNTDVYNQPQPRLGIEGAFLDVLISRKSHQ